MTLCELQQLLTVNTELYAVQ